ncbi:hypothetical protein FA15DRAFT_745858 [Coprinopsis marcescibilis]|uniref:Nephrocystin 3-like N-terminal domain-containing protein n=1 Tax=Coprinopsis marcescibilis TaxID=230819 RepID=A0A5C3KTP0_COPMA|nr:hypothetical protein FA15DRAFT_745858 [Coprinopsis marcescibilis]
MPPVRTKKARGRGDMGRNPNWLSGRPNTVPDLAVMSILQGESGPRGSVGDLQATLLSESNSLGLESSDLGEQSRLGVSPKHYGSGRSQDATPIAHAEVLSNASNVVLENAQMQVAGRDMHFTTNFHNHSSTEIEIQDALRHLTDASACSWDPYRACIPGTRTKHLEEVFTWLNEVPASGTGSMLLIEDGVGSGKTALAHAICQQLNQGKMFFASIFSGQWNQQPSAVDILEAIIRGLCYSSEDVKRIVAKTIIKDRTLANAPPVRQFNEIILPACRGLNNRPLFVVIIDALDELRIEDVTVILRILRDLVPRLPHHFRVIATTRPERRVLQSLENQPHIRRLSIPLTGSSNYEDLEIYIRQRLEEILPDGWISRELIQAFVAKTEGVFLWAATVLNHIENALDPAEELQHIIRNESIYWLRSKNAAQKLDDLYSKILSKLPWEDPKFMRRYWLIMGALVTLKEPISTDGLAFLYASSGLTASDVQIFCTLMRPLLQGYSPTAPSKPLRLLHLSVQEYLMERAPTPYRLDQQAHHLTLLHHSLSTIKTELTQLNVPVLGYSLEERMWKLPFRIQQLPVLTKASMYIPEQLWYACRFVEEHFRAVQAKGVALEKPLLDLALDVLVFNPHLLLEVMAAFGSVVDIVSLRNWLLMYYAMASCLTMAQRDPEALSLAEEATKLYRRTHSNESSPADLVELTLSLHVFSSCLEKHNRFEEALRFSQEGLDVAYRLVESAKEKALQILAEILHIQNVILTKLGQHEQALQVAMSSVAAFRELVKVDSDRFERSLAWSLHNLACDLSQGKRYKHAVAIILETVAIRQRLVSKNPAVFKPELADSLYHCSEYLSKFGLHKESLQPMQEAVRLYRQLSASDPTKYEGYLSSALHALACRLGDLPRMDNDPIPLIKEAIAIRRRLVLFDADIFQPQLAGSLHNYAHYIANANQHQEALIPSHEALKIRRDLAKANPGKLEVDLANSLHNTACYLGSCKRYREALPLLDQAMVVRQKLVEQSTSPDAQWALVEALVESQTLHSKYVSKVAVDLTVPEELVSMDRTTSSDITFNDPSPALFRSASPPLDVFRSPSPTSKEFCSPSTFLHTAEQTDPSEKWSDICSSFSSIDFDSFGQFTITPELKAGAPSPTLQDEADIVDEALQRDNFPEARHDLTDGSDFVLYDDPKIGHTSHLLLFANT